MAIILFAPSGLVGLIVMHGAILRTRAFGSVLASYLIALVPALVMAAGAVLVIEMCYRVSTQAELGTRMRLLGMPLDAATPWPWLFAVALLVVGFVAFRGDVGPGGGRVVSRRRRSRFAASGCDGTGGAMSASATTGLARNRRSRFPGRRRRRGAGALRCAEELRLDAHHPRRLVRRPSRRAPRDHRPQRRRASRRSST